MINEGDNSGPHNRRPEDKPLEAIFQVQVTTLPGLHSDPDQIPLPRILDWEHRKLHFPRRRLQRCSYWNKQSTVHFEGTLLEYPTKVQNIQLFKRAEELISQIGKVFPHVAGSRPFKVLLSKPQDQDWDFMTVVNKDGMVMDVNVVKVTEGREEKRTSKF